MAAKKNRVKSKVQDKSVSPLKAGGLGDIAKYYELPIENLTPMIILHKMSEVLELYLKVIQQILQPEEFHSLHECAAFDDAEKSKLLELYSRIMIAYREIIRAIILNDERDTLSTVQFVHSEVLAVKPMMLDVVKKMQHSWRAEAKKDLSRRSMQYFG